MQSETALPMPNSLASLLISEKERYEKIQKLKEERDYIIEKIQYRFSPEGRKQMEKLKQEAMKIKILEHALFKSAILIELGEVSPEIAAHAFHELYEELEGVKYD